MNDSSPAAQVIAETKKKIRTFLYELAEGSTTYRSLHSLTEQIEHQYHGRVVIELIQNAHDALAKGQNAGRIEIVIKLDEGKFGTLFVANDGACFSQSNFESLSQLGQSDKNPEQSIGNKGIGFRSVLEITSTPQIYSRSVADSAAFDGFCFEFAPSHIQRLADPMAALLRGEPCGDLVDWDEQLRGKFRRTVGARGEQWLRDELRFLSPYLLPFPLVAAEAGPVVMEFGQRGFATVIRLPLKAAASVELLQKKLRELNSNTLLFLDKVTSMVLDDGTRQRELLRESASRPASRLGGKDVLITDAGGGGAHRYWTWHRDMAIADAPAEVRNALERMPGKWPELKHASASLAVRLSEEPEPGVLSIFLPTLLASGCGANINAPFFGDMNRTRINWDNAYNSFLLKEAAALALQVIGDELASHGLDEARAIVDLLSNAEADEEAASRWRAAVLVAAADVRLDVDDAPWFFSDRGWGTIFDTLLIPDTPAATVITREALRAHARFAPFVAGLDSRAASLCALVKAHGLEEADAFPDVTELADTVEGLAQSLLPQPETDWSGFWSDAETLFKRDSTPLLGKHVLLGNDGQLHASDERCTVFFSGARTGEEVGSGSEAVPASLRESVAFLNERILATDEKGGRPQNKVRKFLEGKLVTRWGVEDIFQQVLIKRTPPLPLALDDPRSTLCSDIIRWGLRLMAHLADRGKEKKSLALLAELPVPCKGAWFKLAEASFGPGWDGTRGAMLLAYLELLPHAHGGEAKDRVLLPPLDPRWGQEGLTHQQLMRQAGVFDGLRLSVIKPPNWASTFWGSKSHFPIPPAPPPGVPAALWVRYAAHIKATVAPCYKSTFQFEMQALHSFPGFTVLEELDGEIRHALMLLILVSMAEWEATWREVRFERVEGQDTCPGRSPLAFALQSTPWIGISNGERLEWFRPGECWHIPTRWLFGRSGHFDHLRPLPWDLACRLESDSALAQALGALGMPRYDPEAPSADTRLLEDLARGIGKPEAPNRNILLGQLHAAWSAFEPAEDAPHFPEKLVTRCGGRPLTAEQPSASRPIYLPDSPKSFTALEQFELPVLVIRSDAARRLAARFTKAFGGAVCPTSELTLEPLVAGAPWRGAAAESLHESALAPLVPLLMTLAAFAGLQPRRTDSERFEKRIATLRAAKFSWVTDLQIALSHGKIQLAAPPADALWLRDESVLLATERCRSEPVLLGEAFTHLLERGDLESDIKLFLHGLPSLDPSAEEMARALRLVKLSPEHLEEIRDQWRGDLTQTIRRLLPLLSLLRPDAALGQLAELKSEAELVPFLDALRDPRFTGADLIALSHASADLSEFGKSAWRRFGDCVQLGAWNGSEAQRGERAWVNRDVGSEFRRQLSAALSLLRSLLAAILRRSAPGQSYRIFGEELDAVSCPPSFETEIWEVGFQQTLATTLPHFQRWEASAAELEAIRLATSREDLEARLRLAGVDTSVDPPETARVNGEKLRNALNRLQQIGLAWALANSGANPSSWESRVDNYLAALVHELDSRGYLAAWSDPEVFAFLHALPRGGDEVFWENVSQSHGFQELVTNLGLTEDALLNAQERLQTFKEDVRRRNRLVQIGGTEFDGSEENLGCLYERIRLVLPDDRLDTLSAIDLHSVSLLKPMVRPASSGRHSEAARTPLKIKRPSKVMEDLVGLAGEIHAYRLLKIRYNAGPESWISGNGKIVFRDNVPADGRGCDFEIAHRDRTYFIEVKASEGEDECFTLGSSEVRLAMEVARKKRPNRKSEFIILHVTRALSDQPAFKLLPNPYDPLYQSLFLMDGADVRVRYRT